MTAVNEAPRNQTPRLLRPDSRRLRFQVVLALLTAIVVYAAVQELRKSGAGVQTHVQEHAFSDRRPALTAAEERFSQALWSIHAEVRTAAVRMTFAGLAYKTGNAEVASVRTKVAPLTETFRQASADLRTLEGPDSMQAVRSRYAEALRLFSEASETMVRVAEDGNDLHLLAAQQMSEKAAGMLLEVGDQLWPGEIKPN